MSSLTDIIWVQATKNTHLSNLTGHSEYLGRGEKKQIRRDLAMVGFSKNTLLAIEDPAEGNGVVDTPVDAPQESEIYQAVKSAVQAILNEGDPKKHTTNGRPRVDCVELLCEGIDRDLITAEMVDNAFADVNNLVS